jgi:mannose-6-phosphate isomerase-like protein (cupin superfamily)
VGEGKMLVYKEAAIKIFEADGVIGELLCKSDYGDCVKLEIQPEKELKKHLVDFAATFYVLAGSGRFLNKSGHEDIFKGTVIVADANTERGFCNTGESVLEILVIKHTSGCL